MEPNTKVRVLYNDALTDKDTDETVPGVRASGTSMDDCRRNRWSSPWTRSERHYRPGDPLLEVWSTMETNGKGPHAAAETAYRILNNQHPDGWDLRSMCVGDVVIIGDLVLACSDVGFVETDISASEILDA